MAMLTIWLVAFCVVGHWVEVDHGNDVTVVVASGVPIGRCSVRSWS